VANPVRFRSALKVEIQDQRITARNQPHPGRRLQRCPLVSRWQPARTTCPD
jgi:hypothetical protein